MNQNEEIEELKQKIDSLNQNLQKQEKLASIGMLSAGIAHEVQNPLNFVLNFSKLSETLLSDLKEIIEDISDKVEEDDAEDLEDIIDNLSENLAKIQEHGNRAISVIRGILMQSRGKDGEFLPTDVAQLIHEYVWLSYHAMRANDKTFNVSLHEEYQENIPKLMVVPQDLSRAVLNVMNNACYTCKERSGKGESGYQPTISIVVKYDEAEGLYINITDNGMGMTAEVKERLFENFFTTKPIGQGTGLGMGIIHKIVTEEHKGRLEVETEPGKGTSMIFIIPAKAIK